MSLSDRILIEKIKRGEPLRTERPEVLPKPSAHYRGKHSRYPEQVRISFGDGNTFIYEMRAEQPAPVILENVKIIQRMVGYEPKHARRGRE